MWRRGSGCGCVGGGGREAGQAVAGVVGLAVGEMAGATVGLARDWLEYCSNLLASEQGPDLRRE